MWIKLIITIVTLFLLFDEYFKVVDKAKKRNKRKILLIALSVLSILSLVDVIQEVNEGEILVKKANKILIQSDTLISNTKQITSNLKKNIESVEDASVSINKIDGVLKEVRDTLSNQVDILKESVQKSREIVRLEKLQFEQEEAKITAYTNNINGTRNELDSTIVQIDYNFSNEGIRKATQLKFSGKLMYHVKGTNEFILQPNVINQNFLEDLASKTRGGGKTTIKFTDEISRHKFGALILVLKCDYVDAISKKKLTYRGYFISENLNSEIINFKIPLDLTFQKEIDNFLRMEGLSDFIIE
ncbi:MAG: hypothetical protein WBB27_18205 [Maribacter sp.]